MRQLTLYDLMERLWVISHSMTTTEHTLAFFGDTPIHGVELSDDTSKVVFS